MASSSSLDVFLPQLRDLVSVASPPNEGVILCNTNGEAEWLFPWRYLWFLSDSERLLVLMEPARSSAYDRLAETINRRMRMLHNYQPLMLMELLGRSSPAPAEDIARRILGKDSSQIESTTERVKRMVGRVLTSNGSHLIPKASKA